jgi:hypothetical protein
MIGDLIEFLYKELIYRDIDRKRGKSERGGV